MHLKCSVLFSNSLKVLSTIGTMSPKRRSSDYAQFRSLLDQSKYVVALTGAGVSAESGVPTFRGAGGFWRKYRSQDLANPDAFRKDPSLVWQFYEYRRQLVATKEPNRAHKVKIKIFFHFSNTLHFQALALLENKFKMENKGRQLMIVTQNVDELHTKAGSTDVVELHGNLYRTRCTKCLDVKENYDNPIVSALTEISIDHAAEQNIPESELPHCHKCQSLLRPHIVWFNESLQSEVYERASSIVDNCDLLLVVTYLCY